MISKAAIPAFHALLVHDLCEPHFDPHWHFHAEYQLFTVLEGTGTRFVGDHVQRFGPGDTVLTGPNLPHVWRSDDRYFEKRDGLMTQGIVVYFRPGILTRELLDTQEGLKISQLLQQSERGVAFFGATQQRTGKALLRLVSAGGFDRILGLLHVLHMLSLSDEFSVLSRFGFASRLRPQDQERMQKVHAYVMGHFTEPITLHDVAAIAHMAPTAFSRYFKERTNRPFSRFITELRIGHASKLLVEKDLSISSVAYECGYPTLSNFNRQFKAITGLTPREYMRKYTSVSVDTNAAAYRRTQEALPAARKSA
jgi:AraC-like DNA-binding protein